MKKRKNFKIFTNRAIVQLHLRSLCHCSTVVHPAWQKIMATAIELLTIIIFCKMQKVSNSATQKIALYKFKNILDQANHLPDSGKSARRTKVYYS